VVRSLRVYPQIQLFEFAIFDRKPSMLMTLMVMVVRVAWRDTGMGWVERQF